MGKFGALSAAAVLILGFGALSGTPAAAATATLKSLSVELDGGAAWTPDVADCTECTSDTNAGDSVAVAPGATITVELEIMGDGSTPWECTEWTVGASTGTDQDPANAAGFGTVTETFDLTAPAVTGTYDLFLDARANNGCGAGADFGTINLAGAVIVLEWIDQVHARHPKSVTPQPRIDRVGAAQCHRLHRSPPRARRNVVPFGDRVVETENCALMFKTKKTSGTTENDLPKEEKAPQAAPQREKPPAQHAIIPADLKITGDLVSTGDIHVEGAIHGNITCRALTLSGQPVIKGSVKAETVRIYGTFDGNVRAKKVALTKAARMKGDISYGTLEIEPGAKFEGKVSRLKGT